MVFAKSGGIIELNINGLVVLSASSTRQNVMQSISSYLRWTLFHYKALFRVSFIDLKRFAILSHVKSCYF